MKSVINQLRKLNYSNIAIAHHCNVSADDIIHNSKYSFLQKRMQ